jgi:hypothetical protein
MRFVGRIAGYQSLATSVLARWVKDGEHKDDIDEDMKQLCIELANPDPVYDNDRHVENSMTDVSARITESINFNLYD